MTDTISELFGDIDPIGPNYPGSKTPRREMSPRQIKAKRLQDTTWDSRPFTKMIGGKATETFTIGALADALGRPVVTIRTWTRKGYIPKAPYRLPSKVVNGVEHKGRRIYTRPLIEVTIKAFTDADLMGRLRIEWNDYLLLSRDLAEEWARIYQTETGRAAN